MLKDMFLTRINRRTFVLGVLLFFISFYLLLTLNPTVYRFVPIYLPSIIILGMIYTTSIFMRRFNDIGIPILVTVVIMVLNIIEYLIPRNSLTGIISSLSLLIAIFGPGQKKPNKFGEVPSTAIEFKKLILRK